MFYLSFVPVASTCITYPQCVRGRWLKPLTVTGVHVLIQHLQHVLSDLQTVMMSSKFDQQQCTTTMSQVLALVTTLPAGKPEAWCHAPCTMPYGSCCRHNLAQMQTVQRQASPGDNVGNARCALAAVTLHGLEIGVVKGTALRGYIGLAPMLQDLPDGPLQHHRQLCMQGAADLSLSP